MNLNNLTNIYISKKYEELMSGHYLTLTYIVSLLIFMVPFNLFIHNIFVYVFSACLLKYLLTYCSAHVPHSLLSDI